METAVLESLDEVSGEELLKTVEELQIDIQIYIQNNEAFIRVDGQSVGQ